MAVDPYEGLSDTLSLVFDGIAIAHKGLLKNPSKDQRRKINRRRTALEAQRAEIEAKMDAIEDGDTGVKGPTDAQAKKVAQLTGSVEVMTRANLSASSALALTSKILEVATRVADV